MKKGFNVEYLDKKVDDLENMINKTNDKLLKAKYLEKQYHYQMLYFDAFKQAGELVEEDVSTSDFLTSVNEANNMFLYNSRGTKLVSNLAQEFSKLPNLPECKYSSKIRLSEAKELIGEFIQENFDFYGYLIYKQYFYNLDNYILYDKINNEARTTYLNDEYFILLPYSKDILLASSIAHEAGHIRRMVVNNPNMETNALLEYESFTYEIRFLNWLIENNIYSSDAASRLIEIMTFCERNLVVRYYNNLYKLTKIKNSTKFNERIKELDLMNKANINKKRDLFNSLYSALEVDYVSYAVSMISAINELDNPDFLKTYYDIIANLGQISSITLMKRNNIDITDLSKYQDYRDNILSKIRR